VLSSVLSCNPAKLFMWRNYNYRSRAQRSRYDVSVFIAYCIRFSLTFMTNH
jgi:hypothetical protein